MHDAARTDTHVAIEIYWSAPGRSQLVLKITTPVTWDEFEAGVKQAHAVCAQCRQPIDLIVYPDGPMPEGAALPHFLGALRAQPPNIIRVLIVIPNATGLSALVLELAAILQRLFPCKSQIGFVETLEEALNLRHEQSPK